MPPKPIHSGKVRETYEIDDRHLLIVASDRVSVFDVVLGQNIPDKGRVLTSVTDYWLGNFFAEVPNHYVTTNMSGLPLALQGIPDIDGRGMIVRKAKVLPIEVIVRGYLYGSVMKEYKEHGTACGIQLPVGLKKASELPEPIFTPSTKAKVGHDQNIAKERAREELVKAGFDPNLLDEVERIALFMYNQARAYTKPLGIITADTKFEFGLIDGQLCVVDEVLTPDSSRYWVEVFWIPGEEPISADKQLVRNHYLEHHPEWAENATSPAPALPESVITETRKAYLRIHRLLTT